MTSIRKNKQRICARLLKWEKWVDLLAEDFRLHDLPKGLQQWLRK